MLSHLWNHFLRFISMEKQKKIFWTAVFFLPVINATVFRLLAFRDYDGVQNHTHVFQNFCHIDNFSRTYWKPNSFFRVFRKKNFFWDTHKLIFDKCNQFIQIKVLFDRLKLNILFWALVIFDCPHNHTFHSLFGYF